MDETCCRIGLLLRPKGSRSQALSPCLGKQFFHVFPAFAPQSTPAWLEQQCHDVSVFAKALGSERLALLRPGGKQNLAEIQRVADVVTFSSRWDRIRPCLAHPSTSVHL